MSLIQTTKRSDFPKFITHHTNVKIHVPNPDNEIWRLSKKIITHHTNVKIRQRPCFQSTHRVGFCGRHKGGRQKNGGQKRVTTSLCGCHPEQSDCTDQQNGKRKVATREETRTEQGICLCWIWPVLSASLDYPVETESSLANGLVPLGCLWLSDRRMTLIKSTCFVYLLVLILSWVVSLWLNSARCPGSSWACQPCHL